MNCYFIEAQSVENTSVVTSIPTSPSSYHTNVSTVQGNVNNSDNVINCVSTTPSSLSSTTSPVQVDSHTPLSSLKTIAQKAVDQAGIDISQQSTDNKSNYKMTIICLKRLHFCFDYYLCIIIKVNYVEIKVTKIPCTVLPLTVLLLEQNELYTLYPFILSS